MNYQDTLQLIEQYQNSGSDSLSDFLSHVSSLASDGKTPLGLKQWQSSDKPVMKDFNEDNRIVDSEIRALQAEIEALRAEVEKKANLSKVSWNTATLLNGATGHLTYRRGYDAIFLEGWINGAEWNRVFFTLPAGFRPVKTKHLTVSVSSAATPHNTARLLITPAGEMSITVVDKEQAHLKNGFSVDVVFSSAS